MGPDAGPAASPGQAKSLTIGITVRIRPLGALGITNPAGGWGELAELYASSLVSSEADSRRPVGRLASRVPSLEDGTIEVLADGRMRVTFALRDEAVWQDGALFTAQDLVFSHRFLKDRGLPVSNGNRVVGRMEDAVAEDGRTFVVFFAQPYYQAATLGFYHFGPLPRHLLEPAYERYRETSNPDEVANLPFWTTEHVNLGPYRVVEHRPGEEMVLQAHDRYFLGQPRIKTIYVRELGDPNVLYSNLLAGTVDLVTVAALSANLGFELEQRWRDSAGGLVQLVPGVAYMAAPQWRPALQREPANLDGRVRAGLYAALDRETLAEGLLGSRELALHSLLPAGHVDYAAIRDGLRQHTYSPDRARALLREAGWSAGGDGILRNASDGRRYQTSLTSGPVRGHEIAAIADYWRRVGVDVQERVQTAAEENDLEMSSIAPGWFFSGRGGGDNILNVLEGPPGTPETRWVGERTGYDNATARALVDAYRRSLTTPERQRALEAVSAFVSSELPFLLIYSSAYHVAARAGVDAFRDYAGGAVTDYGPYVRNAHLWDVTF